MSALIEVLFKAMPYLLALSVAFAIGASGWRLGVDQTESKWQAEWNARDARDKDAVNKAADESRNKEQSAQQSVNEVSQNAAVEISKIGAAGDDLAAAGAGLRQSANKLASNSEVSCDTITAKRGASTTRAAMVLSELLGRAEKRLSELAGLYDEARVRGMACQASYERIQRDLQ